MNAPAVAFGLTVVAVFSVFFRYQVPFYLSVLRLEKALRNQGIRWSYLSDWRLQFRLQKDPNAIFSESDTLEVRTLKQEIVDRQRTVREKFPRIVVIILVGFAACIVSGLIQSVIHWILKGNG